MPFEIFVIPGIICFFLAFALGIKAYKKESAEEPEDLIN